MAGPLTEYGGLKTDQVKRLHELTGWIGALGMGLSWPALKRSHVLHHSHTNTDLDPDINVKGTLLQLLLKWLILSLLTVLPLSVAGLIRPQFKTKFQSVLVGPEKIQTELVWAITGILLVAAIWTDHLVEWVFLWFIPTRLAFLMLNVFFQWLPHHPFDHTERYLNTRISLWPGGTWITLQQNLHLVHHLWPSVPFYNYSRFSLRLETDPDCEGATDLGPLRRATRHRQVRLHITSRG